MESNIQAQTYVYQFNIICPKCQPAEH